MELHQHGKPLDGRFSSVALRYDGTQRYARARLRGHGTDQLLGGARSLRQSRVVGAQQCRRCSRQANLLRGLCLHHLARTDQLPRALGRRVCRCIQLSVQGQWPSQCSNCRTRRLWTLYRRCRRRGLELTKGEKSWCQRGRNARRPAE